MSAPLRWYLVVQVLGAVAFVLARPWCARLSDGGYALSKTLGVFLFGFLLWSGTALGLLRNDTGGAAVVLIALVVAALYQWRRSGSATELPYPRRRVVLVAEAIFVLAFSAWCLVRFADPAANHTEQPMDLMLLTAVAHSASFPVEDTWLAGYAIGYYHLGYWMLAAVGHLAALPPAMSYNVGQACWFGLLILTCFGVGYSLAARGTIGSIGAGLLTAIVVPLMGNLHLVVEWRSLWAAGANPSALFERHWWWFRSARAASDVSLGGERIELITEFPAFSYVLGDNHPHVLAMPFSALLIGLALCLFRSNRDAVEGTGTRAALRSPTGAAVLATLVCASLVPLNTWDAPAGALVLGCAIGLPLVAAASSMRAACVTLRGRLVPLLVLGALAIAPFLFTAQSQLRGFLPNLFHPTRLGDFVIVFGTVAPGVLLLLASGLKGVTDRSRALPWVAAGMLASGAWLAAGAWWASQTSGGLAWLARVAPGGASDPVGTAIDRWRDGWPVLALIVTALAVTAAALIHHLRQRSSETGLVFGLAVLLVGLCAVLVPELVYAHDVFVNRMNTVFKFYYQAWLLLGVASALGIAYAWRNGGILRAGSALALAIVTVGCVYAPVAAWHKMRSAGGTGGTFDALAFVRGEQPGAHATIAWIRSHAPPAARVLQAAGRSYHPLESLISTATARPTLIGWEGHERQWRGSAFDGMAAGRFEAIRRIYDPESDQSLRSLLCEWDVRYVYVGPEERARYALTPEHDARLARVMQIELEAVGVRLYGRRGCP